MKYEANPVIVDAHKIVSVGHGSHTRNVGDEAEPVTHLALENGQNVTADPAMTARMVPLPGDYYVIQQDGYAYLNPKDVFERKYRPID